MKSIQKPEGRPIGVFLSCTSALSLFADVTSCGLALGSRLITVTGDQKYANLMNVLNCIKDMKEINSETGLFTKSEYDKLCKTLVDAIKKDIEIQGAS